jgi:hypothetical protein
MARRQRVRARHSGSESSGGVGIWLGDRRGWGPEAERNSRGVVVTAVAFFLLLQPQKVLFYELSIAGQCV